MAWGSEGIGSWGWEVAVEGMGLAMVGADEAMERRVGSSDSSNGGGRGAGAGVE